MFTLEVFALADKTFQAAKMSIKRNKEAKIISIQNATRMLIETRGYDKVTIRDIAETAGVSIGLIYKYFPGGKFDILKGFSYRYLDELFMINQPETIDFDNFPGYMREVLKNMQKLYKDWSALIKAMIMAALMDTEIIDEVQKVDYKVFFQAQSEFFCRFNGVEIGDKNPQEVLMHWWITIKSIILCNIIYPYPLNNEEDLTDMMVNLSLKIWDYQEIT